MWMDIDQNIILSEVEKGWIERMMSQISVKQRNKAGDYRKLQILRTVLLYQDYWRENNGMRAYRMDGGKCGIGGECDAGIYYA